MTAGQEIPPERVLGGKEKDMLTIFEEGLWLFLLSK